MFGAWIHRLSEPAPELLPSSDPLLRWLSWEDVDSEASTVGWVSRERAEGLPGVGRGVRLVSAVLAQMQPHEVRNLWDPDTPLVVLPTSQVLRDPDPAWHGYSTWMAAAAADMQWHGNCFADRSAAPDRLGYPTRLPLITPQRVSWQRSTDPGRPPGWKVYVIGPTAGSTDTERVELDPDDMFHAAVDVPSGKRMGRGIIDSYQATLRLMVVVERATFVVMRDGKPAGMISTDVDMDSDELAGVKAALIAGVRRDGIGAMVRASFNQMSWNAQDLALVPAREFNLRLASDMVGVPPYLLGVPSESRVYCVDTETEILTATGWKRYDEVSVGDAALTLDPGTMTSQWQPVQAVNVFAGPHRVLRLESKSHSSVTTLGHRWPVLPYPGDRMVWATTATMRDADRVLAAAPLAEYPIEQKWSDAFVELIAWGYTEGHVEPYDRLQIGQSKTVNPQYVTRIRRALTALYGPGDRGKHIRGEPHWIERQGPNAIYFRLNKLASAPLLSVMPGKVPDWGFLTELTQSQLHLFIDTSISADGCTTKSGARVFCQKDRARTEALQFACLLAGVSGQVRQDKAGMWQFILSRGAVRKPKGHADYITTDTIDGPVWCPTTGNGTWLARRGHAVYFTGNSNNEGEWSNFLKVTIARYQLPLQDALTRCVPRGRDVRFHSDDLSRPDAAARWANWRIAREIGAMTVAEVRQEERLGPLPGSPTDAGQQEGAA